MPITRAKRSPREMADRLTRVLCFPVTTFDSTGALDIDRYREYLRFVLRFEPAAIFACCGTGEFFSLNLEEFTECVRVAVEEAASSNIPVLAGVGYGTALACTFAAAARDAGADGLLALPPYLVTCNQAGLRSHFEKLAEHTDLGLILYQRDNAIFEPNTVVALSRHPAIIGFKDGLGDLDLLQRIIGAVRADERDQPDDAGNLMFLNGMPTAEMTSLAYRGVGVTTYSSAVFGFAPEIALAFNRALLDGDDAVVTMLFDEFYRPFVELRQHGTGYAISLVKAGATIRGLDVGSVRQPLVAPLKEHVEELAVILERGLKVVEAL